MQPAFDHCEALVRAGDKDRFVATLFAPAAQRGALYALYAFNLEIARVREVVREPLAGEIRLQWWSDVLSGRRDSEAAANPVAAALGTLANLLPEKLAGLIEARRFDLYGEPMATLADLEAYAAKVSAALIELAAFSLNAGRDPGIAALAHHAGIGSAIAGLLKAFPRHAARGQLFLPLDVLERHSASREDIAAGTVTPELRAALAELRLHARAHLKTAGGLIGAAPQAVLPALLPIVLARPALERMERPDYDPFSPPDIPQWRRQWLIWRAARRPARMFG